MSFLMKVTLLSIFLVLLVSGVSAQIKIGISTAFNSTTENDWSVGIANAIKLRLQRLQANPAANPALRAANSIQLVLDANHSPATPRDSPSASSSTISAINLATVDNVAAMVGVGWSEPTQGFSRAASYFNIPVCDGASTALPLSNKAEHPTFFRTVPDDGILAEGAIRMIKEMGWTKIALLYSSDTGTMDVAASAKKLLESLNITILSEQSYVEEQADMTAIMEALQASGATIFFQIGWYSDAANLLKTAKEHGLLAPGYQWVSFSDCIYTDWPQEPQESLQLWDGVWMVDTAESYTSEYNNNFWPYWQQLYGEDTIDPKSNAYYAECMDLLFWGFNAAIEKGVSLADIASRTAQFQIANFSQPAITGLFGKLQLNKEGGKPASILLRSFDPVAKKFKPFGVWDGFAEQITSCSDCVPVRYTQNAAVKPKDYLEVVYLQSSVAPASGLGIFIIILAAVSVLAVIGLMGIVVIFRHNTAIKGTSPPFLLTTLLGTLVASFYPITFLGTPNKYTCLAGTWLVPSGIGLVMGSLIVKTYRLVMIFKGQGSSRKQLGNKYMFTWLALVNAVYVLILLVWTFVDPPAPRTEVYQMVSRALQLTQTFCSSSTDQTQWIGLGLLIAYTVCLLGVSGFMGFITRKLPAKFSESKLLGDLIYCYSAILLFILPLLFLIKLEYAGYVVIKTIAAYAAIALTLGVMFGKKCYQLYQYYDQNGESDTLHLDAGLTSMTKVKSQKTADPLVKGLKNTVLALFFFGSLLILA
ncbi:periplasmic binding protein-like I [Phlyctochytrium arcticum]|nr:periplasmic binding protein-like I [Phlyctochytrium arcticum]